MSIRADRPIRKRICMRPGCGKPVKRITDRFCSPEHKRADYNDRKKAGREAAKAEAVAYKARVDAAVQEILRTQFYCPTCEPEKAPKGEK